MNTIILSTHIIVSLLLVTLILIQHGKGADAGASTLSGGGTSSSLFGSQGSASFLSRSSAILAMTFFFTSLTLAYFSGKIEQGESVVRSIPLAIPTEAVEMVPEDLPELP